MVLPGSGATPRTGVCELCLSLTRPDSTGSAARCSFPSRTQGGVLQSYLRRCCLHQPPAPVSRTTATVAASVTCSNFQNSYSPFGLYSACCKNMEPQLNDSPSRDNKGQNSQGTSPLPTPSSSIPPSSVPYQEGGGITGLRCRTNKTLRFYVLDVALNWPLAVRLGAPSNRSASHQRQPGSLGDGSGGGPFAAIVNLKDEVHYVLHHSPTATLTESLGKTGLYSCIHGCQAVCF